MKPEKADSIYQQCIADISRIYEHARKTVVQAYWQIGKRIFEVEQEKRVRARYGRNIIQQLSEDLTRRYGGGFSATNLKKMRYFYVTYSIGPPAVQLEWSKYVELLSVKDGKKRRELEKLAERERT